MGFQHILFEARDGVARLTLNRPDALNSLTDAMHIELRAALDQVQADPAIRVLVLSGAGRGFCAGQDLADPGMQAVDGKLPDLGDIVERNYKPLVLRLQNLRVPTVAAVNGVAAARSVAIAPTGLPTAWARCRQSPGWGPPVSSRWRSWLCGS